MPSEFQFLFDFDVKYHSFEFYVSNDGDSFINVSRETVQDYGFSYFKVIFIPLNPKDVVRESIKLKELTFRSTRKEYSFVAENDALLELYSGYTCSEKMDIQLPLRK